MGRAHPALQYHILKKNDMQKTVFGLGLALLLAAALPAPAQYAKTDSTFKRWFVGSTLFLLGNLAGTNPPQFLQFNIGYRISGKDVITAEPKTWKYAWPNGIHPFFNPSYGKPEERFPGYVREYGIAFSYQRFFGKGFYGELNIMPTLQRFVNNQGHKTDHGFQLFHTYRAGYHLKLWKDRFFIQPSLAITHRAYHTRLPDGFKQLDDKWSKFVFGEPGCHFGFNF